MSLSDAGLVLGAVCGCIVAIAVWYYRRDRTDHRQGE